MAGRRPLVSLCQTAVRAKAKANARGGRAGAGAGSGVRRRQAADRVGLEGSEVADAQGVPRREGQVLGPRPVGARLRRRRRRRRRRRGCRGGALGEAEAGLGLDGRAAAVKVCSAAPLLALLTG